MVLSTSESTSARKTRKGKCQELGDNDPANEARDGSFINNTECHKLTTDSGAPYLQSFQEGQVKPSATWEQDSVPFRFWEWRSELNSSDWLLEQEKNIHGPFKSSDDSEEVENQGMEEELKRVAKDVEDRNREEQSSRECKEEDAIDKGDPKCQEATRETSCPPRSQGNVSYRGTQLSLG
ncbi:hypothetical protein NDU88_007301 [Pleurodeles waltl]|uniref:Uncharacterized protein n=1 Tax=Pleurodeles waltl TaxID=8319 RepID=A0AAV7QMK8_PLEWA|nr:hypothetical protein NDU88_007301 [Pleurodeles waltl]